MRIDAPPSTPLTGCPPNMGCPVWAALPSPVPLTAPAKGRSHHLALRASWFYSVLLLSVLAHQHCSSSQCFSDPIDWTPVNAARSTEVRVRLVLIRIAPAHTHPLGLTSRPTATAGLARHSGPRPPQPRPQTHALFMPCHPTATAGLARNDRARTAAPSPPPPPRHTRWDLTSIYMPIHLTRTPGPRANCDYLGP
jgi:hypothetical protein